MDAPISLLVVDDEPEVRRLMRLLLESSGYRVFTAGSGQEALEILAREKIRLLITDLRMPEGISGLELAQEAIRRCPGLPFIVISGHDDSENAQEAVRLGGRCLPKPVEFAEVRRAVEEGLGKAVF